jgi:hypothetical protein
MAIMLIILLLTKNDTRATRTKTRVHSEDGVIVVIPTSLEATTTTSTSMA